MRTLDAKALKAFEGVVRREIPSFEVAFKDESKLMALLGFLSYPFNSDFMERYTTTWGDTVFFPYQEFYEETPEKSFRILAHEFVHLSDSKLHPLTFKLSYMFPQILVLLPLLAYAVLAWPYSWITLLPFVSYVLACGAARLTKALFWVVLPLLLGGTGVLAWWLTGWWALVLLGVVLFAIPWPAYWRTKWELRGYGMNVALAWWLYKVFTPDYIERIVSKFTGPDYFFMCWSGPRVRVSVTGYNLLANSGDLQNEHPYAVVHAFINEGD